MQIQIQSSKISDSYSDDYEWCLLQGCGTLHLPTELHGSNHCRINGTSKHNEGFESINICVVTGTHGVIFQKQKGYLHSDNPWSLIFPEVFQSASVIYVEVLRIHI